jgi:hypothetical protein
MNNTDYKLKLHELKITCGINQRYHQYLEWRLWLADKLIRIVVGALAVGGLVLAVPGMSFSPDAGLWVAIVSLVAALVLNIIPVGDWEKTHGELFRLWSYLRKDVVQNELKTWDAEDDKDATKAASEHLCELTLKAADLDTQEPAPWLGLLKRCQGDELESTWGEGIRTPQEVERERLRREQESPLTSPSGAPSASEEEAE